MSFCSIVRPILTKLYRSINRGCPSQAIWYGPIAYSVQRQSFSLNLQPLFYLTSWRKPTRHVSLLHSVSFSTLNVRVLQDVALILLQILDEGTITDSQGRKVDFKVNNRTLFPVFFNLIRKTEHHHLFDQQSWERYPCTPFCMRFRNRHHQPPSQI